MKVEMKSRTKDLLSVLTWAARLLIFLLGAGDEMAMAQDAASSIQKLTLARAVDLALKQNLDIQIANIETASRQQDRAIARAALLPQAGLEADDAIVRYNTKAQLGVQPAIIPHDVGPYQAIHVGPAFSTPLFDLTLIRRYQASGHRLLASQADEQTVREETVLLAVSEYMAHLRALAGIIASQSRVALAQRLTRQAQDLLTDGVASKIDESRAQVRLRQEKQRLIDDQRNAETSLLALKRILNIPDSVQIEITDQQDFISIPSLDLPDPLSTALSQRPELKSSRRGLWPLNPSIRRHRPIRSQNYVSKGNGMSRDKHSRPYPLVITIASI